MVKLAKRVSIVPLVFLMLSGCFSSSPQRETSQPAPKDPETLEWKLAVIQNGGWVRHDAPTVTQFRFYLDHLERKTIQAQQMVADMCVKTWQILREQVNPTEDLLEVFKELNAAIPRDGPKLDLAEVAATYIVLRMSD